MTVHITKATKEVGQWEWYEDWGAGGYEWVTYRVPSYWVYYSARGADIIDAI